MKTFFLVNLLNLLLINLRISSTNSRYVARGIKYPLEATGEATGGLCTLWDILRGVRFWQVPACVRATLTTAERCASPAEVLGIAGIFAASSSQRSPAFAVLGHTALPHRMVPGSWCRLHPAKRLWAVPSPCSGRTSCRQPQPLDKVPCLPKWCILKMLGERGGKFFE